MSEINLKKDVEITKAMYAGIAVSDEDALSIIKYVRKIYNIPLITHEDIVGLIKYKYENDYIKQNFALFYYNRYHIRHSKIFGKVDNKWVVFDRNQNVIKNNDELVNDLNSLKKELKEMLDNNDTNFKREIELVRTINWLEHLLSNGDK